jgi:hypothetical protein
MYGFLQHQSTDNEQVIQAFRDTNQELVKQATATSKSHCAYLTNVRIVAQSRVDLTNQTNVTAEKLAEQCGRGRSTSLATLLKEAERELERVKEYLSQKHEM